jgi:ParB family chromosome partitioning protein
MAKAKKGGKVDALRATREAEASLPAKVDAVAAMVDGIETVGDARTVVRAATAVRELAKQAGLSLDEQNRAAEAKIRAMAKGGGMLVGLERGEDVTETGGPGRGKKNASNGGRVLSPYATTLDDAGLTRQDAQRWQQIHTLEPRLDALFLEIREGEDPEITTAAILGALPGHNHRATGTGENEWYTPPQFIELARQALGGIDLDPASSDRAQEMVLAERYFTKDDDGLRQEWNGRVWLNPPYSKDLLPHFVEKLVEEVSSGRTTAAIMLTHNYTDTEWFHRAESLAEAICFTRGRIAFIPAVGDKAAPTQGQAFFYYGSNVEHFRSVFASVGFVR